MKRRIKKTIARPAAIVKGRFVSPNPTRSQPTKAFRKRKRKLAKLARRANR
jgi:hypothetical protein